MPYLSFTGLAPGTTVYIRFWEYGGDNNGTFSICVHTPPPPPSGDCVYVLNLFDSFGDGWGTSNVGYRINGGPWTYYTVGGSTNQVLIGVNINDVIELTYDASGAYQGENSYSLGLNGGGVYFNSGSPPTAGISFGQLVDCSAPPAAPQDCNGGFTICNGQSFNNNSSNTGNIVDLNTSNQGCLSSGERQGTWYYFSPSSSGTIGFTISPTVVTDYDFAVWGPMSSVSCPPPSAPLRCSYAAPTGDTGAGNGATDPSEGAGGDRWVSPLTVTTGQIYILYVDNFSSNGQSFDLSWQLSGGASLDCTLLPVELVNLTANSFGEWVELDWATLSESNSDHFLVERSRDGFEFHPIGSVEASGTSTVSMDYSFKDQFPMNGVNYYRVVMVDMNGSRLLSPTVTAFIGDQDKPIVAPNPVGDLAYVTLQKGVDGIVFLNVIDASGRLVRSNSANTSNSKRIELPLVGLDHGMYSLLITDPTGRPIGNTVFVK